jgi:hypothetical protein
MLQMNGRSDIARRASFWVAAAVALLVAHDGLYVLELGSGRAVAQALRTAGHGYWPIASTLLLAAGIAVAAVWAVRLAHLTWRARSAAPGSGRRARSWSGRVIRLWPRLLAVVLLAFLVQENIEHLGGHGHVLGLHAIGPEHPLAIPLVAALSAVAALIVAAIQRHEAALLLRLASAQRQRPRAEASISLLPPQRGTATRPRPLAVKRALRAPPASLLPT